MNRLVLYCINIQHLLNIKVYVYMYFFLFPNLSSLFFEENYVLVEQVVMVLVCDHILCSVVIFLLANVLQWKISLNYCAVKV